MSRPSVSSGLGQDKHPRPQCIKRSTMQLIAIDDLSSQAIEAIFRLADLATRPASTSVNGPPLRSDLSEGPPPAIAGSFEGPGTRTRATFLQAFRDLGLAFTELPQLLKSPERVEDLAGYLDPLFAGYVIRESDHARLAAFSRASSRPVINAMSGKGHPCEVLTDAWFAERTIGPLATLRIVLWGPTTNVFRSWHELARVLGLQVEQVCPAAGHDESSGVTFRSAAPAGADLVITDAPPPDWKAESMPLTRDHLRTMGDPALLPTPPFLIGRELLLDPCEYSGFVGYRQKALLRPMHRAILEFVLAKP